MRSRLLFSAACVAAAALALGGDAAGHSRGIETGGTFRVGVVQQGGPIFTGVDPALSIDTAGLLRPACGSLMAYPDAQLPKGLVLVPELAEKAPSVTNDGETYTFTIRRDAYFSTGAHVTARDVVHTLERILNPKVRSGIAPDFSDIVGARKMLAGKARSLSGAVANGRSLTLRLTGPLPDLPARMSELCIVPATLPPDPEGAKAPLPSAAPYYISEYAPGERVVLVRNRFYRGKRPQHVDEFDIDLAADFETLVDQVASGKVQYAPGGAWMASHVQWLVKHYGVNKSQFLAVPGLETHLFVLNTSRPLFRNNASLRRAINFAVDRRTLVATEHGAVAETPSDTYIPEAASSAGAERVYPFRPDLRRARSLARGHLRSGRAVLYTCTDLDCIGPAQVLQQDLKKIGLNVVIKTFQRTLQVPKLATPGEPYDIARVWVFSSYFDPSSNLSMFDGRTIGQPGGSNFSHYDSPAYDRSLDRAARLSGTARLRAYHSLDVNLARNAAPAVSYANGNDLTFVAAKVGCVVVNPLLDLTAVCLK